MSWCTKFVEVTGTGWITIGNDVQYKLENRILYLQCSASKSDWKYNLMFWQEVYSASTIPMKAHQGFKELWLSIKPIIESLDFDTIVGYSQGAAIAVFVHENHYHRKGFQPMTYAFGCPRVLVNPAQELRNRFTQFIRIKNEYDLVTLVPPVLFGYRHVGVKKIIDNVAKKPKGEKLLVWLSGHSPSRYLQNLEGCK